MTKWFILPGMGASSKMYNALRQGIEFEIQFLEWTDYRGEKSYEEVAERIISGNHLCPSDVVGGSSVGEMVALEIAMLLNSEAVILMGSALMPNEIAKLFSMLSPV